MLNKLQWGVNVFAHQCANHEFETQVYDYAHNDIKHCFGHNYERKVNTENDKTSFQGLYTV